MLLPKWSVKFCWNTFIRKLILTSFYFKIKYKCGKIAVYQSFVWIIRGQNLFLNLLSIIDTNNPLECKASGLNCVRCQQCGQTGYCVINRAQPDNLPCLCQYGFTGTDAVYIAEHSNNTFFLFIKNRIRAKNCLRQCNHGPYFRFVLYSHNKNTQSFERSKNKNNKTTYLREITIYIFMLNIIQN